MELGPPLHLDVVAIEKGAFGSPSTMVANFIFTYILFITEFFSIKTMWITIQMHNFV